VAERGGGGRKPECSDQEGRVPEMTGISVMGHQGVGRKGVAGPLAQIPVGGGQRGSAEPVLVLLQQQCSHLRVRPANHPRAPN